MFTKDSGASLPVHVSLVPLQAYHLAITVHVSGRSGGQEADSFPEDATTYVLPRLDIYPMSSSRSH